jgi:hypothetical protein
MPAVSRIAPSVANGFGLAYPLAIGDLRLFDVFPSVLDPRRRIVPCPAMT